ncbi:MAG: RnfABCDGE type electron transport complex subunit B [Gammaproteobacteria bacterium]|nr:MAG: RnfABCDGE type electron transport complex subunit B [Gammaproteobacteria bacterium]
METKENIIPTGKYIARIVEEECIGCTLCIKACPFDAIIGASKHLHTVISQYCTGCKLCLPPCPVDCIRLDINSEFEEVCKELSKPQQSELKKSFAAVSRNNKDRRDKRLEEAIQAKQAAFERKKKELMKR